jgi:peptidoglycan/LPS O-acetylase OafA/YrhL
MTKSKAPTAINSMHGMRALSVLWVVMGHRRFFHLFFALTNANEVNNWLENIRTVIFQTDHLAVDTFFVMGGMLLAISFMRDLDKKQVSLWRMYLRRYVRYTPLLMILILHNVTLNKFMNFGPAFNFEGSASNCRSNWWAAMLHIQNYVDWTKMCFGVSWYLSADFQLFLISPLFIYLIWKFNNKCLWILPTISIGTVIYLFVMAYIYEVPVFYLKL